ncbi:unnamed protein product [Schistosoma curassoni]|uniref:Uncharacterized protein n=1 Tax=Schistosoma curassoni TaxID=6186 RepID=A0A183JW77_9TREM|nr:unnamed protein product [Schistosoma curassoni]
MMIEYLDVMIVYYMNVVVDVDFLSNVDRLVGKLMEKN